MRTEREILNEVVGPSGGLKVEVVSGGGSGGDVNVVDAFYRDPATNLARVDIAGISGVDDGFGNLRVAVAKGHVEVVKGIVTGVAFSDVDWLKPVDIPVAGGRAVTVFVRSDVGSTGDLWMHVSIGFDSTFIVAHNPTAVTVSPGGKALYSLEAPFEHLAVSIRGATGASGLADVAYVVHRVV